MLRLLRLLALAAVIALPAVARTVAFVDNTRIGEADGSPGLPFSSIAVAASRADIIYVLQTSTPYVESVSLRKGQMLIGSAYGLDAVRAELPMGEVLPAAAAQEGTGPIIKGTINLTGDNVVAGVTIVAERGAVGITSAGGQGSLKLRKVIIQPSQHSAAIAFQNHDGPISIIDGGVQAGGEGMGIAILGGNGEVTIERFPLTGAFSSAVRVIGRANGAVTFRNGSSIRTDDATDDAISIANMETSAPVTFSDRIQIRGRRRGFVASKVAKLTVKGGDSWLATTGGAALDLRDVGCDVVFNSVSAENTNEGLVADKVRGKLEISGRNDEPGSGGTIRAAKNYGVRIVQSSNVRIANLTIAGSGSQGTVKGAKCIGDFEVSSVVPCNAALYLRHLQSATFQNIIVDGGGAMGLNASNIRDLKFENIDIHGAGDESFEAGVLLQEVGDGVQFVRGNFADNAGSEVRIEQRFNTGRLTFQRCVFAAPTRPTIAPQLIAVHAVGGKLDLELHNSEIRDNAGGAIDVTVLAAAALNLTIADTIGQHLGTGGVTLKASDTAHATVAMTRVQITAPAARAIVDLTAAGSAGVCADLSMNALAAGGPAIVLTAAPPAQFRVVSAAESPSVLGAALAAANGGTTAAIHVPPGALAVARSCH